MKRVRTHRTATFAAALLTGTAALGLATASQAAPDDAGNQQRNQQSQIEQNQPKKNQAERAAARNDAGVTDVTADIAADQTTEAEQENLTGARLDDQEGQNGWYSEGQTAAQSGNQGSPQNVWKNGERIAGQGGGYMNRGTTGGSATQSQDRSGQGMQAFSQQQQSQQRGAQAGQVPPNTVVVLVPQDQLGAGFHDPQSRMSVDREGYGYSTGGNVVVVPVPSQGQNQMAGLRGDQGSGQQSWQGNQNAQNQNAQNQNTRSQYGSMNQDQARSHVQRQMQRMQQQGQSSQQQQAQSAPSENYASWRANQLAQLDQAYTEWRQNFVDRLDQAYQQQSGRSMSGDIAFYDQQTGQLVDPDVGYVTPGGRVIVDQMPHVPGIQR